MSEQQNQNSAAGGQSELSGLVMFRLRQVCSTAMLGAGRKE